MTKIIVIYTFEKIDPIKRKQFHRNLFGSVEKTHGGKYFSETKGILSEIPYKKPVNSVILTEKKVQFKVEEVLKKFEAKYEIYDIN
jgi:hypothetical protein